MTMIFGKAQDRAKSGAKNSAHDEAGGAKRKGGRKSQVHAEEPEAAAEARSLWRRSDKPLGDLPVGGPSLLREGGSSLPRFSITATDDPGEAARSMLGGSSARARMALANVLGASQPVINREQFAGRHGTLSALISAIEQQRAHVVLYGERGIGKTSLVHVFAETAREAGYLVLYGSCGVEADFDEMFRSFVSEIPLLYHSDISPTANESEHDHSFASLLGDDPLDPRVLAGLLQKIVGTRIIVVLDEYDRAASPAFRRDIAELIKNLSDRAARVQLILTGVGSNLDELIGFTPSIRRNIIGIPVGPMDNAELEEILARAEAATDLQFSPVAREFILRMSGGSPYLARLLGNRAAGRALDEHRRTVADTDVLAGTEAVLAEWNAGLPRRVQAQLQRSEVQAQWSALIAAARASGTPDGWFNPHDLSMEAVGIDPATARSILDRFTGEIDLFDRETEQDGRESRYRFRTQGVSQLLGLSAALARAER